MRNFTPAYRRAAYFIVAAILAVLVAAGLITEAQYDSWTGIVEQLLPILGTGALLVAGAKTNQGSDDPTTREDVALAYQAVQPVYTPVQEPISEPVNTDLQPVDDALESARAAYRDTTRRE